MKIKKTKSKRYPIKISWNQYKNVPIPYQHAYKTQFINKHGCSLVALYILARCAGSKKTLGNIYKFAKRRLNGYLRAKYTIRGVAVGVNKITNKTAARYYPTPTTELLKKALLGGHVVAFEQRNPIHTVVLVYDKNEKQTYVISDGKVSKTSVADQMKKVCKDQNYKGCVIL